MLSGQLPDAIFLDLCLPRLHSSYIQIFVCTVHGSGTNNKPLRYVTPCACARGKNTIGIGDLKSSGQMPCQ